MSEAELYLINQRMRAGRVNKARRGELVIAPGRLLAAPLGEAVVDPDEQVQGVVRLVFAKFAELGSVQGVVRFLVEHGIQFGVRARSGPDKGKIVWKRPARATITGMINSPISAGSTPTAAGRATTRACAQHTGVPGPGGGPHAARSAWPGSRMPCPPTSRWPSTRPTWPGSRPTGRTATCPERSGSGRRCWPGCCAAAAAGAG